MRALIGHTGFIGRNLARQRTWDVCFNRQDIDAIRGRSFELVVCAGLPSNRSLANGNPGGDRSNMMSLANALAEARAERFVLVSTIDVYPVPVRVDESTVIEPAHGRAYGEHRLEFERMIAARFAASHVLRLPEIFGPDMRRNVLDDLIRRRDLDAVDPRATHQWYPVARLADDIDQVIRLGLPRVNLCSAPVDTARLHRAFFDDLRIGGRPGATTRQDVRTLYGRSLGGDEAYLMSADHAVEEIRQWLRTLALFGGLGC
jgi:hypothetical protein